MCFVEHNHNDTVSESMGFEHDPKVSNIWVEQVSALYGCLEFLIA